MRDWKKPILDPLIIRREDNTWHNTNDTPSLALITKEWTSHVDQWKYRSGRATARVTPKRTLGTQRFWQRQVYLLARTAIYKLKLTRSFISSLSSQDPGLTRALILSYDRSSTQSLKTDRKLYQPHRECEKAFEKRKRQNDSILLPLFFIQIHITTGWLTRYQERTDNSLEAAGIQIWMLYPWYRTEARILG